MEKIAVDKELLERAMEKLASLDEEIKAYRHVSSLVADGLIDPTDFIEKVAEYCDQHSLSTDTMFEVDDSYEPILGGPVHGTATPETAFCQTLSGLIQGQTTTL